MKALGSHATSSIYHPGPVFIHPTGASAGSFNPPHRRTVNTLSFNDDPCLSAGEGITRTSNPRATLWPFEARFPQGRPMRGTIRATGKQQAQQFAQKRHPHATQITILSKKELAAWL